MKKKKILILESIGYMLLLLLFFPINVRAEADFNSFFVSPVLSEHQTEGITDFFDIIWTPGNTEKIGMKITNRSDKEMTYNIEVHPASVDLSGNIIYTEKGISSIKNAPFNITELVSLQKSITIPSHSSHTIDGEVLFPTNNFDGLILGGIVIMPETEKTDDMIINTPAYTIPVLLRGNIDRKPISEISHIDTKIVNYDNGAAVVSRVLNEKAKLMNDATFTAKLISDQGEVILHREQLVDIVPNGIIPFPLFLEEDLKSGIYTLKLSITKEEESWDFEDELDVKNDTSAIGSNNTEKVKNSFSNYYQYGFYGLLIVMLLFFLAKKNIFKHSK